MALPTYFDAMDYARMVREYPLGPDYEKFLRTVSRDELYALHDAAGVELLRFERAAAKHFGFIGPAAHLNGLVSLAEGLHMWIATRSASKAAEPGKLDNMVAGGIAAGIFGAKSMGGLGGVSLSAQLIGTTMGVAWAVVGGVLVYGVLKMTLGLRLSQEEEYDGADLSIHKISASPEREANW